MNAQSRALQEELSDALNIIDVFAKLDAEIAGCTTRRGRTYFFVINDGDDVVINFEITAEQHESIERMEKATLIKDVED